MAGTLATVMDDLGTALGTITGLRVFDFPPKSAQVPFAFVDMPESIDYDATMKRGFDRATINVVLCVADVIDRAARDAIAPYAAGAGASSVKAAIESGGVGESARVESVQFRPVVMAGTMFFGAVFTVDVVF